MHAHAVLHFEKLPRGRRIFQNKGGQSPYQCTMYISTWPIRGIWGHAPQENVNFRLRDHF